MNVKSLDYLEEIKRNYILSDEDLADIVEKIGYIARDNNMSDEVTDEICDYLNKK